MKEKTIMTSKSEENILRKAKIIFDKYGYECKLTKRKKK